MLPQEAADKMLLLSEEQSRLSDEYAELEEHRLRHFKENRENFKSDKACETAWQATEEGIKHMRLNLSLKKIAKELSVLKTFLRHEENKARNIY